jgi:hypothetical protein
VPSARHGEGAWLGVCQRARHTEGGWFGDTNCLDSPGYESILTLDLVQVPAMSALDERSFASLTHLRLVGHSIAKLDLQMVSSLRSLHVVGATSAALTAAASPCPTVAGTRGFVGASEPGSHLPLYTRVHLPRGGVLQEATLANVDIGSRGCQRLRNCGRVELRSAPPYCMLVG